MKNAQFSVDEFLAVLRRRRKAFLLPALMVITACGLAAFLLPRQYKSSTTIMVQEDDVLNPLVSYNVAVAMETDPGLGDFNEILYSRPTIESLMDSLGMETGKMNPGLKAEEIKQITKRIQTARNGSNTFTISYFDTMPATAQKAVKVLSELFIQTRLDVQNRKNDFAVSFFQQKVMDLRDKFEKSQGALVDALQRHINELPEDDRTLYSNITNYNNEVQTLDQTSRKREDALKILEAASKTTPGERIDLTKLYMIPLLDVPFSDDLQSAVTKYDQLSSHYTQEFPDVQAAREKVLQLVGLVEDAIRTEQRSNQNQIWSLERRRDDAIKSVQMATVAHSQDQDLQSNFSIYENLYNEMKVKLEQAQTSRDLAQSSARDYIIIDPPDLPVRPAKPNKALVIGGGFGLGLFLGLLSAGLSELFDTRIRTPKDVESFEKPIIAYLPQVRSWRDK